MTRAKVPQQSGPGRPEGSMTASVARAVALTNKGHALIAAALKAGCSPQAVRAARKRMGLPALPRRPGGKLQAPTP